MNDTDFSRRFGGIGRLYGEAALARFTRAHVCVVGVGGVGSWAVEALARSAVGRLTLIDLDNVAASNVNRQLHALTPEFGKAKVTALAERIALINPAAEVIQIEDFVTPENVAELIDGRFDAVIDAIDQLRTKIALIAHCRGRRIPVVTTGAAGGKLDPTRIQMGDLARTIQDPLLSKVRTGLRKHHGFPRGDKARFGVEAVFSSEPIRYPERQCLPAAGGPSAGGSGLNCAGFGSAMPVTASFGLMAAGWVLRRLAETPAAGAPAAGSPAAGSPAAGSPAAR